MRTSWRGARTARAATLLLALAAALVSFLGCGALGIARTSTRIEHRASARAMQPARAGQRADALRTAGFDETADGRQIYLYWWHLVRPGTTVAGVARPPRPGSWYVSPALRAAMRADPNLAARYAPARDLGTDGVASPGELLAYRFLGTEARLHERLVDQPGADWIGDPGEAVERRALAIVALGLLGLPALGLLLAGTAPLAAAGSPRRSVIEALGADRSTVLAWHIGPVLLASAPGALAGATLWWALAPGWRTVPLVGHAVFPGDLGISAPTAGMIAVLTVVCCVVTGRSRRGVAVRPTVADPGPVTATRLLPLAIGVVVMATGVGVRGRPGAELFVTGLLATTIGAAIAAPWWLALAGARLARHGHVLALLVGRSVANRAGRSARALVGLGAVAILVPVLAAWVAVNRQTDAPQRGAAYAIEIRGAIDEGTAAAVRRATGIRPMILVDRRDAPARPALVADCAALGATGFARCGPDRHLEAAPGHGLEGLVGAPVLGQEPPGSRVRALILVSAAGRRAEHAVRALVIRGPDPGLQAVAPSHQVAHESPLVAWLLGTARVSFMLVVMALGLHIVVGLASGAGTRTRLVAVGVDPAAVRGLVALEAIGTVGLVGATSAAIGTLSTVLFVWRDGTIGLPVATLVAESGTITILALATGLGAAMAMPRDR